MGLLDSIAGQVPSGGQSQDVLTRAIMKVLNHQEGGLGGLVEQFTGAGLGDIVNSWVSTGANLPVTPAQLQKGFGAMAIGHIVEQAGISQDDVLSQLSKALPGIIDKLTPNGALPQGFVISQGRSLLKDLMK
jgi:uncharacterized protein YidB (DUF937 family)